MSLLQKMLETKAAHYPGEYPIDGRYPLLNNAPSGGTPGCWGVENATPQQVPPLLLSQTVQPWPQQSAARPQLPMPSTTVGNLSQPNMPLQNYPLVQWPGQQPEPQLPYDFPTQNFENHYQKQSYPEFQRQHIPQNSVVSPQDWQTFPQDYSTSPMRLSHNHSQHQWSSNEQQNHYAPYNLPPPNQQHLQQSLTTQTPSPLCPPAMPSTHIPPPGNLQHQPWQSNEQPPQRPQKSQQQQHQLEGYSIPRPKEPFTRRLTSNPVSYPAKFHIPEIEEFGRSVINSCQNVDASLYEALKIKEEVMPALEKRNASLQENVNAQQQKIKTLEQDMQNLTQKIESTESVKAELEMAVRGLQYQLKGKDNQLLIFEDTLSKTKEELFQVRENTETIVDDKEKLMLRLQTQQETINRLEKHKARVHADRIHTKTLLSNQLLELDKLKMSNIELQKQLKRLSETIKKQDQEIMGQQPTNYTATDKTMSANAIVTHTLESHLQLKNYVKKLEINLKEAQAKEKLLEEKVKLVENQNKQQDEQNVHPQPGHAFPGKRQRLGESNENGYYHHKKMKFIGGNLNDQEQQPLGAQSNWKKSQGFPGSKKIIIPHLKFFKETSVVGRGGGNPKAGKK